MRRPSPAKEWRSPPAAGKLECAREPVPPAGEENPDGVLAPNARLRARVVALGRDDPGTSGLEVGSPGARGDETAVRAHEDRAASLAGAAARSRWARLLVRIYEVFPSAAPTADRTCASSLSSPTPSPSAPCSAASTCLTPRRDSPPRALHPQAALEFATDPVAPVDPLLADDFDQTPVLDPADPEPVPALDLDQTRGA
jgi:hypothetical protein